MPRINIIAVVALTFLLFASEASAFNRKIWDGLTRGQQNAYLIGAFEVIITSEPDEPLHTYKSVLWQCYKQEKFDADFMRELVVEEYQSSFYKHSNQENIGAGTMLLSALEKFCRAKGFELY